MQDDRSAANDGKAARAAAVTAFRLPRWCRRGKTAFTVLVAITLAAVLVMIGPRGFDSGVLLVHQDDPVALADHLVAKTLDATVARREIEDALADDDPELAASFVELASEQGIALDPTLIERVAVANSATALAKRAAGSFAHGFVSGEPQTAAGFAGTAVGDLFVFGDVRDAVREGSRFASGEKADEFILGLACVGLVVTAGTYASLGAATPVRAGMSLVKGAYKTGRIGGRLAASIGRTLRGAVDLPALRTAISSISLLQPRAALRGMRASVKLDRAGALLRLMGDTGRVQARAGTRAAMDGLRIAERPKDMARVARLADAKGGKTRAILKLGGRAAVALTVASFKLASWLFSAVMMLFGFCSALKGLTERITHRWFVSGRARRLRRARRAAAARRDALGACGRSATACRSIDLDDGSLAAANDHVPSGFSSDGPIPDCQPGTPEHESEELADFSEKIMRPDKEKWSAIGSTWNHCALAHPVPCCEAPTNAMRRVQALVPCH